MVEPPILITRSVIRFDGLSWIVTTPLGSTCVPGWTEGRKRLVGTIGRCCFCPGIVQGGGRSALKGRQSSCALGNAFLSSTEGEPK